MTNLLTNRDDEGGESVTTDDTTIVHNVLRRNLTVHKAKQYIIRSRSIEN